MKSGLSEVVAANYLCGTFSIGLKVHYERPEIILKQLVDEV